MAGSCSARLNGAQGPRHSADGWWMFRSTAAVGVARCCRRTAARPPPLPWRHAAAVAAQPPPLARGDVDRGDLAGLDAERRVDVLALRPGPDDEQVRLPGVARCRGSRPGSSAGPSRRAGTSPRRARRRAASGRCRRRGRASRSSRPSARPRPRDRRRSASRRSLPSSRQHPWAECTVGRPWVPGRR